MPGAAARRQVAQGPPATIFSSSALPLGALQEMTGQVTGWGVWGLVWVGGGRQGPVRAHSSGRRSAGLFVCPRNPSTHPHTSGPSQPARQAHGMFVSVEGQAMQATMDLLKQLAEAQAANLAGALL